jgi:hypothetical protein
MDEIQVPVPELIEKCNEVFQRYGFTNITYGEFTKIDDTYVARLRKGSFQEWPPAKTVKRFLEGLFVCDSEETQELLKKVYKAYRIPFPCNKKIFGEKFNFNLKDSEQYKNRQPSGYADALLKHQESYHKPTLIQTVLNYIKKIGGK